MMTWWSRLKHYSFRREELEIILNDDIKYRMGRGGDEAED